MFSTGLVKYTLTIVDKTTDQTIRTCRHNDLSRLLRIKEQYMSKHPGRYNCMIQGPDLMEFTC